MLSKSLKDTSAIAQKILSDLLSKPRVGALAESNSATVLALVGELGAGKTTFVKAFLRAMGIRRRITSPTFLIMRKYPINVRSVGDVRSVYHVDAYRIKSEEDLLILGFREILKNKENLVLIEWADAVKKILPRDAVWIYMRHGKNENERNIEIQW